MQITIKAHFNKYTKDSKKQLVQFYVKGEDEDKRELDDLCREVVFLSIKDIQVSLNAHFCKKSKDDKKTVLDFLVKGDKLSIVSHYFTDQAGKDVTLTIAESQMSIEDFHKDTEWEDIESDEQEGLKVNVNGDGTVELVADKEEDEPNDPMDNVGNTPSGRTRPLTKKEKEEAEKAAAEAEANQKPSDDDLPM
jgi:hypothetical protein